jgi:hypothetical protein
MNHVPAKLIPWGWSPATKRVTRALNYAFWINSDGLLTAIEKDWILKKDSSRETRSPGLDCV